MTKNDELVLLSATPEGEYSFDVEMRNPNAQVIVIYIMSVLLNEMWSSATGHRRRRADFSLPLDRRPPQNANIGAIFG